MKLTNQMRFEQGADAVYARLLDLDALAGCLAGATLGAVDDAGVRQAGVAVQFGPMRFGYKGTVRMAEIDAMARRAVFLAEGKESSGEGTAQATIVLTVAQESSGSRVDIDTDLRLRGGVAQVGRGMIEEVAQEQIDLFAANVARLMAPQAQSASAAAIADRAGGSPGAMGPEPIRPLRLLLRILTRRVARLFQGNPRPR